MAHRRAPRAQTDLGEIWYYTAKGSGSIEIANRLIDSITDRFYLLSGFPHAGRARNQQFGAGIRSFPVGEFMILYSVEGESVFILRVVHGRRDIGDLFRL